MSENNSLNLVNNFIEIITNRLIFDEKDYNNDIKYGIFKTNSSNYYLFKNIPKIHPINFSIDDNIIIDTSINLILTTLLPPSVSFDINYQISI